MSSTMGSDNLGATGGTHSTVDQMRDKAHETVDRVAASAGKTEETLRGKAAEAEARMHDMGAKIGETAQENTEHLKRYVRENPLTSAGIAFAAGVVLSAILRR